MINDLLARAASEIDRAFSRAALQTTRRARTQGPESLGHNERMRALEVIQGIYSRPDHFIEQASFFPTPTAPSPMLRRVRTISGGEVLDASWPSELSPFCPEVAEKYLSHAENRSAAARLFLHKDRPRPAAILIHGYRAGQFAIEERIWPVTWLFDRGLDVALAVLPFHAVRGSGRGAPRFPSNDPRVTNEGFRQAVFDLGALRRFLIDRGAPSVGVMGMSLGGYTSSLLATLEDGLSFVVPIIPLASLADVARQNGRLVGDADQQRAQHAALDEAHRVVSPFGRPSRIPRERVLVVGAAFDRITPIDHAERLARHFGAPLEVMRGGHIVQVNRPDGFRAVGRMLGRLGLFSRPRSGAFSDK